MSNLRKTVLARGTKRFPGNNPNDCTPVNSSKYFEKEQHIYVNNNSFCIYTTGNTGPVLLLIHGGGYSAHTWALFTEEITSKIECQILAIDLRGHGNTITNDEENLSLTTFSEDVSNIVNKYYDNKPPPIVLIGHSLGGAIAVDVAIHLKSVIALCVIDVVEGTALESLSCMQSILRGRPNSFKSIEHAIQWSFRSGQTHNIESARVSMPGQIKNITTLQLAANESFDTEKNEDIPDSSHSGRRVILHTTNSIIEESDSDIGLEDSELCNGYSNSDSMNGHSSKPPISNISKNVDSFKIPIIAPDQYTWRIDLSRTEPFWSGWFKGLSQKFLDVSVPKVLLLANIHGLDTTLTVGQMQGKFQLQVLARSGHAIHEDQPQQVADIIAGFLVKQKLTIAKGTFVPAMPAC